MSLKNESPNKRRTITIEIDEAQYQFLLKLGSSPSGPKSSAEHLADRILHQQMAEEMKLAHYLGKKYHLQD